MNCGGPKRDRTVMTVVMNSSAFKSPKLGIHYYNSFLRGITGWPDCSPAHDVWCRLDVGYSWDMSQLENIEVGKLVDRLFLTRTLGNVVLLKHLPQRHINQIWLISYQRASRRGGCALSTPGFCQGFFPWIPLRSLRYSDCKMVVNQAPANPMSFVDWFVVLFQLLRSRGWWYHIPIDFH